MAASTWITIFQWVGVIGATCALISLIGLWHFGARVDSERQTQIGELRVATEIIARFHEMAMLDLHGSEYTPGSNVIVSTPLTRALEGTFDIVSNRLQYRADDEALTRLLEVTEQFPDFPFGHYAVAYIYRTRNDSRWREYAEAAVEILEKTVSISGRNASHDRVLNELKVELSRGS